MKLSYLSLSRLSTTLSATLTLACIILACFSVVRGDYTVEVRTHNFSNPGSLLANGDCCDYNLTAGDGSCAIPGCDHYFYYCLRSLGSTGRGCSGGRVSRIAYNDYMPDFSLPTFLGLPNPLPLRGLTEKWNGIQLLVQVYEYDQAKTPELVQEATYDIKFDSLSIYEESSPIHFTDGGQMNQSSIVFSFRVVCGDNNYGMDCSQYCNESDCGGNGQCVPGVNNYSCTCYPGYSGGRCEIDINECSTLVDPCNGRGECVDGVNNFSCICDSGFTGNDCNQNIDDCVGVSCSGNGQCIDGINNYTCVCNLGFTGEKCDININECETMNINCSGRGSCQDGDNDYSCICDSGFTGSMCEENINDCVLGESCSGHGHCIDGISSYSCTCFPGFTGQDCDLNINECEAMDISCSGRGVCLDGINNFTCSCNAGFIGKECEVNIDDCIGVDCSEHGQCVDAINDYVCECDPGYTAAHCDIKINECEAFDIDCSDRGQCVDNINSYLCICDAGFTGKDCEVNIDECTTMTVTCSEHGRCVDGINEYTCVCDSGFTGDDCSRANEQDHSYSEDPKDPLQLQLIGGVFIGIVAFGLIFICVFGILIGIVAYLRKSQGNKSNKNVHSLADTTREAQQNNYVLTRDVFGGQWQQFDNPLYRNKMEIKSTSSEPIFDDATYTSVSTNASHSRSGSSGGLSNRERSNSLEHEFNNPIYGYGNVRFNDTPTVHRFSADLQHL